MKFPEITSKPVLVLSAVTAAWLALVVVSPFLVPSGTLTDLSGSVGIHDNDQLFSDLAPLPKAVYWIGDAECHQKADRSFFLNGNQMPFCARDLGIFIGLAAGSAFVLFRRYKVNPLFVLLGLVPIAVDGGTQLMTSYESNNALRLATGFLAGLMLSLLLAHFMFALQEDSGTKSRPEDLPEEGESGGKPL